MTWYQASTFTPSGGPIAASASPGAVSASGWTDVSGNIWSVNSSNRLVPANAGSSTPWDSAVLARPSSEAQVDGRVRIAFTAVAGNGVYAMLRTTSPGPSTNCYFIGIDATFSIGMGQVLSGTYGNLGANGSAVATAGQSYVFQADCVQTNGTTTALTGTLFAADGTTQLATFSMNSTTAALQNVSGVCGVFEYIPSSATGSQISSLATYTDVVVSAATALTLTGPTSGIVGQASSAFTVAANGTLSSNVIATPSDGGAGGTFSPTSVTLTSSSTSGTFTYTPASAGSKTISITNNGGLTNPANATYAATVVTVIPVNSAAFRFSPGNWKGDTGRGGSVYRQTWNPGAYFEVSWTAASSPTATLLLPSTSTGVVLSYFLNGTLVDGVAASGAITLSGVLPNATNTLFAVIKSNTQSSRWNNGTNVLRVQGLQVDQASAAGTASVVTGWDLIIGDSLTEGIQAADGADSNLKCWSYLLGQAIRDQGRDYCISACGYSGWLRPGDSGGDIPAYYSVSGGVYSDSASRWNKIDQGVSLLDTASQISAYGSTGTAPSSIYINYGTNEAIAGSSTSDLTASVIQGLTTVRGANPSSTRICVLIPFALYAANVFSTGATYIAALKAGFNAYKAANPTDLNTFLIDFGASFSATLTSSLYGGAVVHPNSGAHALEAARMIAKVLGPSIAPVTGAVNDNDMVQLVRNGTTLPVQASVLKAYLGAH